MILLIASKRLSHGFFDISQTKDKFLVFRLRSCLRLEQVLHLVYDPRILDDAAYNLDTFDLLLERTLTT